MSAPQGKCQTNNSEGDAMIKKVQDVNHDWPNDKRTWFKHIPEGLKS